MLLSLEITKAAKNGRNIVNLQFIWASIRLVHSVSSLQEPWYIMVRYTRIWSRSKGYDLKQQDTKCPPGRQVKSDKHNCCNLHCLFSFLFTHEADNSEVYPWRFSQEYNFVVAHYNYIYFKAILIITSTQFVNLPLTPILLINHIQCTNKNTHKTNLPPEAVVSF